MVQDGQRWHGPGTIPSAAALMNRRPKLTIVAPDASPEEAAAVVAALERFMRETVPVAAPPAPQRNPWQQAALQEGVLRQPAAPMPWE
jgi:hypothetical protein